MGRIKGMNHPAASCEVSIKPTHPLIPSLKREGKPAGDPARRGELKPKQSFEEFYPSGLTG
jgi:hypothetical protein